MDDFRSITVSRKNKTKTLLINNPTNFPLIGKGKQGAVFKISEDRCVKIFLKPENVKKEKEALLKGQGFSFMPIFYESGPNYIIMEYIKGKSLIDYLKKHETLPESIADQLIKMKRDMKRLGFTNLDRHVNRHLIVNKQNVLKVVDHANAFDDYPFPVRLLQSLTDLGFIEQFLHQTKQIDYDLYVEWKTFLKYS
jgi:predicted Ser/Thr protein kinase